MAVKDAFMTDDNGRKFVANPQQSEQPSAAGQSGGGASGGGNGSGTDESLQGRSRLTPNGDASAPQNGSVNSNGSFTTQGQQGGAATPASNAGTDNTALTEARTRRNDALTNNPFRENGYYTKIFKETTPFRPPTAEEIRRSQRRERSQKIVSAIGDGISSLANLYFTTQYAPNAYNPQLSLSAASAKRWEQLRKERQANTEQYMRGLMEAAARDDANTTDRRNFEWNIYNAAARDAEGDRDFNYRVNQDALNRQERAAAVAKEEERYQAEQKEQKRHNRAMESRSRGGGGGGGGGRRRGGGGSGSSDDTGGTFALYGPDDMTYEMPLSLWNNDSFIDELWTELGDTRRQGSGWAQLYNARSGQGSSGLDGGGSSSHTSVGERANEKRAAISYLLSADSNYHTADRRAVYNKILKKIARYSK